MNVAKQSVSVRSIFIIPYAVLALAPVAFAQDIISTLAGGGPNALPATGANLQYPVNTAVDSSGNYYIVSQNQTEHRVFKVNSSGTLTVLAGTGIAGYSGDGGLATQANLYNPGSVAVDSSGNAYIADQSNCVVRKVSVTTGDISTYAGTPQSCGFSGDGGAASAAQLNQPRGLTLDAAGNLYIADEYNQRIRKVTGGNISTVAGNGTAGFAGDGAAATAAELYDPMAVTIDPSGNIYIADFYNYRVRQVNSSGTISTFAGNGTYGFSGDGGSGPNAQISYVYGLATDSAGKLFIADTANCVIRQVTTADIISTVAGNHTCGFAGDGSSATSAELNQPYGVSIDSTEHLYIADYYNLRVRKAALGSSISTVAGSGLLYFAANGTPASGASVYNPSGVSNDRSGNVYIADQYNYVIRKVNAGTITTLAGTAATSGYTGNGGPATSALLSNPTKAVTDAAGNVYFSDTNNCVVREVTISTGLISNFAGNASCGFSGDGAAATAAQLDYPDGLSFDSAGNLYIADTYNHRIRKVSTSGIITTVAGNGTPGYGGDGGPAANSELNYPEDVAVDGLGNLYVADTSNNRIREVLTTGIIDTFAGNGAVGFQADGVPAIDTSLNAPMGVAVDIAGDVLIGDFDNYRVRWVNGAGTIYTVAGSGTYGFSGDGGVATAAELARPWGVSADASGNIYVADSSNNRIREVTAFPNLNASSYNLSFEQQGIGTYSDPQQITLRAVGSVTIHSISVSGGSFLQGDNCPSTLSSGAACTVDVVFSPTTAGLLNGTLTVGTNGLFTPTLTINLSGTGGDLSYSPTSINFGNQVVGTVSAVRKITVINTSTVSVTFTSVSAANTQFAIASNTCTGTLAPGNTCSIGVTLTPTSSGALATTLVIKDSDKTSPQLVPLRGVGIGTSVSPAALSFGTVHDGSTGSLTTTLTNKGTAALSSVAASVSGTNAADFTFTTTCGATLAGGGSCTYTVHFKPTNTGAESASLKIADSEGTFTVALTGTGQQTSLSPTALNYGSVAKGSTATLSTTLRNTGTVTLTSIAANTSGANAADFTFTSTCGTSLAGGSSCTFSVTFKPTLSAAESASLNVVDSEGTFPVTLSGTGH